MIRGWGAWLLQAHLWVVLFFLYVPILVMAAMSQGQAWTVPYTSPGEEKIVAQGGVMKIPTTQKRTIIDLQMKQVARELALRLKATSWFD